MPCGEHGLSIADILRDHMGKLYLGPEQAKAVAHILACRTSKLGGHLAFCNRCGARHCAYHSCRDRHCPRCGGLDQRLWAEAQLPHLLLGADPPLRLAPPGESRTAAVRRIFGVEPDLCPTCKLGRLVVRAPWRATRVPLDAVLATLSPRGP